MQTSFAWVARGAALLLLGAGACTAPRGITTSGKVTPQGEFRVAYNQSLNLATAPLSEAGSAVREAATQYSDNVQEGRPVRYSEMVNRVQTAAIAYLLDPVQTSADFGLRYGVAPRFDVGYKYALGSHVFDTRYQFLGATGSVENPGRAAVAGSLYANVGLQFAAQRSRLPSIPFLGDVNDLLGFDARRYDLLVPVTFSNSLGREEAVGAISYGVAYGHSWLSYALAPRDLYDPTGTYQIPSLPRQTLSYSSFGLFANLKLGYKYVYVVPAFSLYYQNYGTFTLLDGSSASLSGWTFIPSIGLQARIPSFR